MSIIILGTFNNMGAVMNVDSQYIMSFSQFKSQQGVPNAKRSLDVEIDDINEIFDNLENPK